MTAAARTGTVRLQRERAKPNEWINVPTTKTKLISPDAAAGYLPVDPCTLGRPFHLLGSFTNGLREQIAGYFERRFNRRYGAQIAVTRLAVCRPDEIGPAGKWRHFRSATGRICFAPDRALLLSWLDYRYGGKEAGGQSAPATDSVPETETELRLAAMLGIDLLDVLVGCLDASVTDGHGGFRLDHHGKPASALGLRVDLRDDVRDLDGTLWFALDDAWLSRLLASVSQRRKRESGSKPASVPLASQLQITLTTRLLTMEMSLGEILDTRVGDVIPVSIGPAEVLVDESPFFTASVAEHNGKLWLTSFEHLD